MHCSKDSMCSFCDTLLKIPRKLRQAFSEKSYEDIAWTEYKFFA